MNHKTNYYIVLGILSFMGACELRPVDEDGKAQIIKYESEMSGLGSYRYSFETSNGISREETGEVFNEKSDQESFAVYGSYRFTAPDGSEHVVHYIADKAGFRPTYERISGSKVPTMDANTAMNANTAINANTAMNANTTTEQPQFVDFIGTAVLASLSG